MAEQIDDCGNVASPLVSQGFVAGATITGNTLVVPADEEIGIAAVNVTTHNVAIQFDNTGTT